MDIVSLHSHNRHRSLSSDGVKTYIGQLGHKRNHLPFSLYPAIKKNLLYSGCRESLDSPNQRVGYWCPPIFMWIVNCIIWISSIKDKLVIKLHPILCVIYNWGTVLSATCQLGMLLTLGCDNWRAQEVLL